MKLVPVYMITNMQQRLALQQRDSAWTAHLEKLLQNPLAVEMFNQMAPGMLEGPMIQFAYGMSLAELIGAAPQAKPLYEAVVNALNQKERE